MVTLIKDYSVKSSDAFLIDTNVWLFLFAPIANYELNKQQAYANLLQLIQERKGHIALNSLILSEFTNVLYWKFYSNYKEKLGAQGIIADRKKLFLKSTDYKDLISTINSSVTTILSITHRYSDDFGSTSAISIPEVMGRMQSCSFTDSYLISFAQYKKLKIVTDDSDFKAVIPDKLEVITYKD